jgi:hypothetical protein
VRRTCGRAERVEGVSLIEVEGIPYYDTIAGAIKSSKVPTDRTIVRSRLIRLSNISDDGQACGGQKEWLYVFNTVGPT